MRIKNVLNTFSDFELDDLEMEEQQFEDFKSKYLDLYDKVKPGAGKEKVSILEDVDFELELIHRDEINVTYILKLLANLKNADEGDRAKKQKEIIDLLTGEANLRSKRELIERFILESLPQIEDTDTLPDQFEKFWNEEQIKAFKQLVKEENLSEEKTEQLIENYLFAEREPLREEVINLIKGEKPTILQRKTVGDRILNRIISFVDTFVNGFNKVA
jgi:type I restriction enzyme R subunit